MGEEPDNPAGRSRPGRSLRAGSRVALGVCTAALLTATHWPGLAIEGPIDRTDLLIHASVFAVWAALLAMATGWRMPALLVVGVLFAGFDEATQPLFNRVFDWTDLGADVVGVFLGSLGFSLLRPNAEQNGR